MRYPLLPLLLAALALTACGKDDPAQYPYSDSAQTDPEYWQDEDFSSWGVCEHDVIERFRDVREACDRDYRRGERSNDCQTYSDGFFAAYPSMRCRADGGGRGRVRPYGISSRHVRWMSRSYGKRFDNRGNPGMGPNGQLPGNMGRINPIPQQPPYPRQPNYPQGPNFPQPQGPNFPQNGLPSPYPGYFQTQPGMMGPQGNVPPLVYPNVR